MSIMVIADLASIEYRVAGWVARSKAIWSCVKLNRDPYLDFAVQLYHDQNLNYEELEAKYNAKDPATVEMRQNSKPPVLAGGFGLGGGETYTNEYGDVVRGGLWGYALNVCGVDMPQELAHLAVKIYRETNYEVVQAWADVEQAFKWVLKHGKTITVGEVSWDRQDRYWAPCQNNFTQCFIKFSRFKTQKNGYVIRIHLPSGRCLHYVNAQIREETVVGKNGKPWTRDAIYYEGIEHSSTQGADGAQAKKSFAWGMASTHGGKIFENVVQAIARDILMNGCHLARNAGFKIWGVFHDEIATEVEESFLSPGLDDLILAMSIPPKWGPTLILGAAGYISKYYKKG